MPYVSPDEKKVVDPVLNNLIDAISDVDLDYEPGLLNYVLTKIIHNWLPPKDNMKYFYINEVIGVLRCCEVFLIETVLIPYEKTKMKENGNISELDKNYYETLLEEDK